MDTQKEKGKGDCEMLARLAHRRTVVGSKQLKKALAAGSAKLVLLARNADPAITEPIEAMCRQKNVECVWVASKAELGQACGIEVGAAAAAAVQ